MTRPRHITRALFLAVAGTSLLGAVASSKAPVVHERKEVAGLAVVFGAEPEPALTEEMQFLRWRVSALDSEEPYAEMEDAVLMVIFDGEEFGPFPVRASRRDPGLHQSKQIFTEAGEYRSVLRFRKGEDTEVHEVDFDFSIRDRASFELPGRRGGG